MASILRSDPDLAYIVALWANYDLWQDAVKLAGGLVTAYNRGVWNHLTLHSHHRDAWAQHRLGTDSTLPNLKVDITEQVEAAIGYMPGTPVSESGSRREATSTKRSTSSATRDLAGGWQYKKNSLPPVNWRWVR